MTSSTRRHLLTLCAAALALPLAGAPARADHDPHPTPHPMPHVSTHGRHHRSEAGWRGPDAVFPVVHTDTREESYHLPGGKGRLVIDDVAGNVLVRGTDGDTVHVVARQTVRGGGEADVALGLKEMPLELAQRGESVVAYVDAPFRTEDGGIDFDDDVPYRVVYDFTVEVPRGVDLDLRTVLDGNVDVHDVRGAFEVRNVNGSVALDGMGSAGTATTVNGDLQVSFRANPRGNCDFGNVNGKVDVVFQPGLAADVRWRTLNGDAWSDFPFTTLPVTPQVSADRSKGRYRVKSEWEQGIRIGGGGPQLSFGTVNGNIYLRQAGRGR